MKRNEAMEQYIKKSALLAELERRIELFTSEKNQEGASQIDKLSLGGRIAGLQELKSSLDTLEVKEVDLEKESELIANGIMIGVQANKYHTCVYNTARCDFNHSHLMLAARKGIELGLKAQKGEEV